MRAAYVFAGTMGLLLAPKLIGYLAMLADRADAARLRRRGPRVLQHACRDHDFGPDRAGDDADPVVIRRRHPDGPRQRLERAAPRRRQPAVARRRAPLRLAHARSGLLLALAAYEVSFSLFAWMTPVIVGLLLAIPLAQWSASPAAGRWLRRMKLLLVPEESRAAGHSDARQRAGRDLRARRAKRRAAFARLFADPGAADGASRPAARTPPQRKRGEIDAALVIGLAKLDDCASLAEADAMLTRQEKMARAVRRARRRSPGRTCAALRRDQAVTAELKIGREKAARSLPGRPCR